MNIYMQGFARLLWSMADEGSLNRVGLAGLSKLSQNQVPVRALTLVVTICAVSIGLAHLGIVPK